MAHISDRFRDPSRMGFGNISRDVRSFGNVESVLRSLFLYDYLISDSN